MERLRHSLYAREGTWESKTTSCGSRDISEFRKPPRTSAEIEIATVAKSLYRQLGNLNVPEMTPAYYLAAFSLVRDAKSVLQSANDKHGPQTTELETLMGAVEQHESEVLLGIYAHLSNREAGGSISQNPTTHQSVNDYFEITGPLSSPTVCASGIHSDIFANRHSDGETSLASIVYPHCPLADCSRIANRSKGRQFATGCEGQWGRGSI